MKRPQSAKTRRALFYGIYEQIAQEENMKAKTVWWRIHKGNDVKLITRAAEIVEQRRANLDAAKRRFTNAAQ